MNQTTLDFIENSIGQYINRLSASARKSFILMAYVGLCVIHEKHSVNEVAREMGIPKERLQRILGRFETKFREGDAILVNLIRDYEGRNAPKPKLKTNTRKVKTIDKTYCMGFVFTEEENTMAKAAIKDANRFMATYGRGQRPRLNGEYYAPGTNVVDNGKWLLENDACLFCGCTLKRLETASERGKVEKRLFRKYKGKAQYEYSLSSLEKFIKSAKLI